MPFVTRVLAFRRFGAEWRSQLVARVAMLWSLLTPVLLAQVVDLNSTSFNNDCLTTGGKCLILFHLKTCTHCKSISAAWTHASMLLHDEDTSITVGRVDGSAERFLARRMQVQNYPTIIYFGANNSMHRYTGPRTAAGMVKFAVLTHVDTPAEWVLPVWLFAPTYLVLEAIEVSRSTMLRVAPSRSSCARFASASPPSLMKFKPPPATCARRLRTVHRARSRAAVEAMRSGTRRRQMPPICGRRLRRGAALADCDPVASAAIRCGRTDRREPPACRQDACT